MKEMWNERYAAENYVYGTAPNEFFKDFIDSQQAGSILLAAEGEGRNAVYAALQGWQVHAVDFSEQAKRKALALAQKHGVSISYSVADLDLWDTPKQYDVIGLFYAHFPEDVRRKILRKLLGKLKPGGEIVMEAFSREQLNFNTGGPRRADMLFSLKMLREDFTGTKFLRMEQLETQLNSGDLHKGKGSIIRMIVQKP